MCLDILKLSGPVSNCLGYGESWDIKGKEICDLCEYGYILSDDELSCELSPSNC